MKFTSSKFSLSLALLALPLLTVVSAHATTTIFTTLTGDGGAYPYGATSSSLLTGGIAGSTYGFEGLAAPFTLTAGSDYDISSVDLLLGYAAALSADGTVDVEILSDNSGMPGGIIGSDTQLTVSEGIGPSSEGALYNVPINDVTGASALVGGTQYWLAVLPVATTTYVGWYYNNSAPNSTYSAYFGGPPSWTNNDDDNSDGAAPTFLFDVNGTGSPTSPSSPSPEPGTLALLGFGLGVIVLQRRRRVL